MTKNPISAKNRKRLDYISYFLREMRLANGYTQDDLCQNMHLHRNSISRAESSKNITLLSLFEIADSLEINLKELFEDIE
jgi:transcriptional regulator with XRE-family HTH domain